MSSAWATTRTSISRRAPPSRTGLATRTGRSGRSRWRRLPAVDTELRLRAFAAEDAVAALARAASGRYVGTDVLDERLLCTIGPAGHHMIREYRTLLRAIWLSAEACPRSQAHDDAVEQRILTVSDHPDAVPAAGGGTWNCSVTGCTG